MYLFIFVEIKEAAHILSSVDNGKIGIPNLEHALESLNVNLTEEDISEALKCCDISGEHFFGMRFFSFFPVYEKQS